MRIEATRRLVGGALASFPATSNAERNSQASPLPNRVEDARRASEGTASRSIPPSRSYGFDADANSAHCGSPADTLHEEVLSVGIEGALDHLKVDGGKVIRGNRESRHRRWRRWWPRHQIGGAVFTPLALWLHA
eukprot:1821825-Prymnesium_polylepis.1